MRRNSQGGAARRSSAAKQNGGYPHDSVRVHEDTTGRGTWQPIPGM